MFRSRKRKSNKNTRRAKQARRLRLESLEQRQLMAADLQIVDGVLEIEGTDASEEFVIEEVATGDDIGVGLKIVITNLETGEVQTEQFGPGVGSLKILAGAGDDVVRNFTDLSMEAHGEGGEDDIMGGGGDDVILGGDDADVIYGMGGDDVILGGDGDDGIYGNSGNDEVWGGDGKDYLDGGGGDDSLYGGNGADTLLGQFDDDFLAGDGGEDTMYGGQGKDVMFGGADDDRMFGGTHGNVLGRRRVAKAQLDSAAIPWSRLAEAPANPIIDAESCRIRLRSCCE